MNDLNHVLHSVLERITTFYQNREKRNLTSDILEIIEREGYNSQKILNHSSAPIDIIKMLIEAGADPYIAVEEATRTGNTHALMYLRRAGVEISKQNHEKCEEIYRKQMRKIREEERIAKEKILQEKKRTASLEGVINAIQTPRDAFYVMLSARRFGDESLYRRAKEKGKRLMR